MLKIQENLSNVKEEIINFATSVKRDPANIALLAVSKTKPAGAVLEAYQARLRQKLDEVMAQCEGVVLRTDFLAAEREGLLTVTMLAECEEEIGRTVERDGQTGRVYGENSSRSEE